MSDFPVRQMQDRVHKRAIVIIAAVGVLITVAASAVPAWILERRSLFWLDAPVRASNLPVTPREIGLPDQTLLESQATESRSREKQRQRLERYGWIDRERGLVHIPIERAMTLLVAEQAAATSGAERAPTDDEGGAR